MKCSHQISKGYFTPALPTQSAHCVYNQMPSPLEDRCSHFLICITFPSDVAANFPQILFYFVYVAKSTTRSCLKENAGCSLGANLDGRIFHRTYDRQFILWIQNVKGINRTLLPWVFKWMKLQNLIPSSLYRNVVATSLAIIVIMIFAIKIYSIRFEVV